MNRQELVIQEGRYLQDPLQESGSYTATQSTSSLGLCHSEMAMHAAKKMRRSKQKQKTGRDVCHHLRMMLAANEPVVPLSSALSALSASRGVSSVSGISPSPAQSPAQSRNDSQYSLGI